MPRSSSKLWPPRRAPRSVRSAIEPPPTTVFPPLPGRRRFTPSRDAPPLVPRTVASHSFQRYRRGEDSLNPSAWPGSHDPWHVVPGLPDALLGVHLHQQQAADEEEEDEREDGGAVGVGELVDQTEHQRPEPRGPAV